LPRAEAEQVGLACRLLKTLEEAVESCRPIVLVCALPHLPCGRSDGAAIRFP